MLPFSAALLSTLPLLACFRSLAFSLLLQCSARAGRRQYNFDGGGDYDTRRPLRRRRRAFERSEQKSEVVATTSETTAEDRKKSKEEDTTNKQATKSRRRTTRRPSPAGGRSTDERTRTTADVVVLPILEGVGEAFVGVVGDALLEVEFVPGEQVEVAGAEVVAEGLGGAVGVVGALAVRLQGGPGEVWRLEGGARFGLQSIISGHFRDERCLLVSRHGPHGVLALDVGDEVAREFGVGLAQSVPDLSKRLHGVHCLEKVLERLVVVEIALRLGLVHRLHVRKAPGDLRQRRHVRRRRPLHFRSSVCRRRLLGGRLLGGVVRLLRGLVFSEEHGEDVGDEFRQGVPRAPVVEVWHVDLVVLVDVRMSRRFHELKHGLVLRKPRRQEDAHPLGSPVRHVD
mmetsp:Transcript_15649/g.47321  ORF Transcript_15649/g.47321 Transcript_15649/m.47321 type:complete len:399 (+) Transcript_15649:691-1887(+)